MIFDNIKRKNSLYFLIADNVEKVVNNKFKGPIINYKTSPECSQEAKNTCDTLTNKIMLFGDTKITTCCASNKTSDAVQLNPENTAISIYETLINNLKDDYNIEDLKKDIVVNMVLNILKNYNVATFDGGYEISHKLFVSVISSEITDILLKKNKVKTSMFDYFISGSKYIFLILFIIFAIFNIYDKRLFHRFTQTITKKRFNFNK